MTRLGSADRLPALAQTIAGALAVVLGLTVIVGWQTGSAVLTQVQPGLPAMQYITALAFVIAGVGLLCAVSARNEAAGIAGMLVGAIGLLSLAQDLLHVDPDLDFLFGGTAYVVPGAGAPARMAPNTALCFGLVGIALVVRRAGAAARVSIVTGLLGSTIGALGLVALAGYASDFAPAYGWGQLTRMAVHTATGFVFVGCGIVVRGWRDAPTTESGAWRFPALIGVSSLVGTIFLWQGLLVHEREQSLRFVRSHAVYLRSAVSGPLEAQVGALEKMAHRWETGQPIKAQWLATASEYLRPPARYHALETVDGSLHLQWFAPADHSVALDAAGTVRSRVLDAARVGKSTVVSPLVELTGGGEGFYVVSPVIRDGAFAGAIVGVLGFTELLEAVLQQEDGVDFRVAVLEHSRQVYGRGGTTEPDQWASEVGLDVRGARWRFRVWPTPSRRAELEGRLPYVVLAGGLLLSAVVACMTFFAGTSRRREQQLREQMAEREAAQGALAASEARYRSLVDSASDIIYRVAPSGHFTYVNPVASRVMNRPESELVGMHFLDLVEPSARAEVARFYAEQVANRVAHTYFEFPAIGGDGQTVWIGQSVALLVDNDTVCGLQAVARDVTERKHADAEFARARDAALESDRLKSEFVANVSHELRTPMNGILGLTEALLETDLTPEQRDHASTVRDCGETLLILLNDILDLSKVEAGKLEIQSVAFDLRRLVQQTADLFAVRARQKGVDLVYLVHHGVPKTIMGDPGRLRQVLTNLLGNAVKFTERGEITLRVKVEDLSAPEMVVRLEVADTGIGVSAEAQAQLFQPFVQADGSITRKYGGTGLGLVISRQLAVLMGGEMGMTSQVGRGSTFWFTVRTTAASAPPPALRSAEPSLRGLRVLALDDSDSGRRRLRELLESWNMHVVDAGTSEGALEALKSAADRSDPFDVVLVELRSVGASAFDFAGAAQAGGFVPPTRMVLVSGRGQPGDAQRAHQLGASAYLTKPIRQSQLFDCLATVMGPPSDEPPQATGPGGIVTRYTLEHRPHEAIDPLLVVEDNVVNQKVLVGLLRKLGYRADVANNGVEALAALARTEYALVLMDSQMPEMDGFATTAAIRQREGDTRHTIIVAVTAHAMKGERERCLAAGMDDYISKPVSREQLSAVVARWLTDGGASKASLGTLGSEVGEPDGIQTAEAVIDAEVVERLRELDTDMPGLFVEVISTFLRETPPRIERLMAAVNAGDATGAQRAAHGLKGSAGAVGAVRLTALCEEIERQVGKGDLSACMPSVAALESAFGDVNESLQRHCLPAEVGSACTPNAS